MDKKQKIALLSVFAAVIIVIGAAAGILNHRATQEGMKKFQVEVISERDDFSEADDCESDLTYLGEFLRTYEACQWEESTYGIYLKGFYGMEEDIDNQYWWNVTINGENATTGADEIPLSEGDVYTFTLMQGW